MKETKYTPKRLLSLLLVLIMLLGMFPTATLAAGTEDGIVLNSGEYKNSGLVFKFEPILPEGPYFQGDGKQLQIHYTISTATGDDYVEITELSEFSRYDSYAGGRPIAGSSVTGKKASDSANSEITKEVTTADGSQKVRVYNPGVVIAEGDFSNYNYISADGDNLGKLVQNIYFAAFWYGTDRNSQQYSTNTGESGGSNSIERCSVSARYLPLGYTVAYSNGGYSGVSGIPEGTFRTTGSSSTNQTFKISDVEPTLAGCTFKGWRSNEWKKTGGDGNELTGDAALFQPGDTVEKVTSDTVLTAVWDENASEHKVEFYHNFPDGSDETLFTTVHVADGEGAENPGAPYKHPEGYIFKDWCVKTEVGGKVTLVAYDFATPVTEDIELYADWTQVTEETTYTVTFDVGVANAGPVPAAQVVKKDAAAIAPTTEPTRDGYTFGGWYLVQDDGTLAGAAYDFGTAVTKDITLRAKWTRNQVRITWPTSTSAGETLTHPGYTEDANHSTMVDVGSTVTFRVQWHKEYDPATVLANDLPLGGRVGTEDEYGVIYTYQFTANEDTTITVNPATKKTYTITLPSGNGFYAIFADSNKPNAKNAMSYTFEYGDTFTIKFVAQAGMQAQLFVNGQQHLSLPDGGEAICPDEHTVTGDCVVSAFAMQRVFHTVTYVLEPYSGLYTVQSAEHGQATSAPAKPEIPGYEFEGWYSDAKFTDPWVFSEAKEEDPNATPDTITRDTVIYGKLTKSRYSITFDANVPKNADGSAVGTVRGMPNDDLVMTNATTQAKTGGKEHGVPYTIDEDATPTLEGYVFKGWATSADGPVAYQPGSQYLNDASIKFYAVWEKLTYTVTISSGAGYSTVPAGIGTVEWGNDFTFIVNVDRDYAAVEPKVYLDNSTTPMQADAGQTSDNSAASWKYIIPEVKANHSVRIEVTRNLIHKVAFYAVTGTTKETTPFLTQSVEHGYYASMPAAPEREGYKFKGYYSDEAHTTLFRFEDQILKDENVYAYYEEIQPQIRVIPVSGTGWELKNWQYGKQDPFAKADLTKNNPFTIAYGDDVTFDLVIQPGYDYSKLSVSANGYELGRENIKTENGITTISFRLVYVTANTRITVSGIERKTITVTYNENALDHVSNLPAPQTANYYIKGDKNNTNFTDQAPVRNGYTFLGWALSGTATEPDYKIADIQKGLIKIPFDKDTTVYAIWAAKDQKVTLKIVDEYITSGDKEHPSSSPSADGVLEYAYEGDTIFLVGELEHAAQGTMTFYKKWRNADANAWKQIGTVAVNGGQYGALEITAEPYRQDSASTPAASSNYRWDYKVVFTPANEEGYKTCEASDDLRVYSKAISWVVDKKTDKTNYKWINAQNTLSIYSDEALQNPVNGAMIANNTYWLQIPKVIELDGGLNLKNNMDTYLTVGEHYTVQWEYQDENGTWQKYGSRVVNSDSVRVTPEFSGYVFRAKVYPADASIYTKAATYDKNGTVQPDKYYECLITATTEQTEVEATKTTLTIDAEDELNSIVIKNETPFETLGKDGSHKAQFEGQTITLTAKVTKTDETTAVNMGTVEFYRQVTDANGKTSWVSIGTAKLEDEGTVTGEASIEFQMPAYDTGKAPIQNKEVFKAVYVQNVTYKTSTSANGEAYIKSAQLQIPVIADADSPVHTGKLNDKDETPATATTYEYDLTGLTAGIKHTFQLKQTGADKGQTADWSVVALDGRTVAGDMYTMKWETLTDANWKTTTTTGTTYTAETTKVGDRYHILLTGAKNSPFDGSEVVSQDIVIGELQDVKVTVVAIDAIKATEVDRDNDKYPDVYQLNEIILTATVEAKEDGADRQPQGTVAFYYVDENKAFQPLGEAELIKDKSGKMVAELTTDELPVETKKKENTNLTSVITAVYYGDETFKPSENWEEKDEGGKKVWTITSAEGANKTIQTDKVTVYSSVVYYCTHENKLDDTKGDLGIHISDDDGVFKANESATLKLSDVYTLDRELGDDLRDTVAKLNPNKDYTIQWQKLTGATTDRDFANSKRWEDISGATGTTLLLKPVEQDTAYRAVITVANPATPIVKGSFELVDQAVKGRQVYYSNVLMPTSGETTIAVAVNTDKTGDNLEGITEGETVTVNVLVSGAVGAVPNATLDVTIKADDAKGNKTGYEKTFTSKATVDGWNAFDWDTEAEKVQPGFYTLTVEATSNTGYEDQKITRSLIVRESTYKLSVDNLTPTYNGRTQGVTVALENFHFNGYDIDAAAEKSWTVKYYKDAKLEGGKRVGGTQVEPSQAGAYVAEVTLPASAYWTEQTRAVEFKIQPRKVYVEDAVAQAKIYDGDPAVNLVEVILNDAVTDQTTGLPTGSTGIINGDSIYATATGTLLKTADAGERTFQVTGVNLYGDDAGNYVVDETKKPYEEPIYVSRSQVYGETGTLKLKQGDSFPAADVIKMIDQSGSEPAYTLTFYYHSDTKIEKTEDLSKTGLYTVVARPKQDNYKGGVAMKFEVVKDAADAEKVDAVAPQPSTLITISNTAELYGHVNGVSVDLSNKDKSVTYDVVYLNGANEVKDAKTLNAGRYIVKVTASTGDVAYGIYTITKAHPEIRITADNATYNSMQYAGAAPDLTKAAENPESYLTYAGDVAIGFDVPTDGNVAEQAPVDAGSYVVTLHVNETTNYTAHEVSAPFVIAPKQLTITTHSKESTQYDAFPAMTAKYEGLAYNGTADDTNDTSLRDVQIAPEFLFNYDKKGFTNDALDQVGGVKIKPADALAKNYDITYVDGEYTRQRTNFKPDLAIYGLPVNGEGKNVAYYGDEVQLYHYGYYTDHENGSSVLTWNVEKLNFTGTVTIGRKTGILNVNGVGTFTVTLTRGDGEQAISTTATVTASKKELGVHLLDQDKVYNGFNQDYSGTVTVYDELYKMVSTGSPVMQNVGRTNIGTQLPSGQVPAAETYYQSLIYRGKYTINDKEATVAPQEDTHIYGEYRKTKGFVASDPAAISDVQTASQTDDYNRLDVHDGYEILVAGTENMNYNVKYVTDQTAKDSEVTTYGGVKFTSETKSKTTAYLNDATVYGETPNVLDWTLENTIASTRGGEPYADNLADFDLDSIFIWQDKDDCVGNADCGKFDYKAANRTTTAPDTYNVGVLGAKRTAADENAHPNYTLKFKTVTNSGALNYKLDDKQEGNKNTTTEALRAGSLGYDGGNALLEDGENFVEGSANIAQRPVTVTKASTIGKVSLYWRLPQSKLYTALLNILEAEANFSEGNGIGRGLAKGHTIKDLDLKIYVQDKLIDPNSDDVRDDLVAGPAQVRIEVGDTNYVLDGNGKIDDVELKAIQIEATYTTKTATNFVVLIKVRSEDRKSTTPLTSADGLSYEIFRKVNGIVDDSKVYASGSLTYTGRTATDKFGDECGVFTASYGPLASGSYFIQMYEYGVALKTENS